MKVACNWLTHVHQVTGCYVTEAVEQFVDPLISPKLKLNLKVPLDIGYKSSSIIWYNMRATATLIFDKCLYLRGRLRLTTARRLSAYMSSRALATTTATSYFVHFVTSAEQNSTCVVLIKLKNWLVLLYCVNNTIIIHILWLLVMSGFDHIGGMMDVISVGLWQSSEWLVWVLGRLFLVLTKLEKKSELGSLQYL